MKKFSKKVDLRSREKMVEFLTEHPRYCTMNSWNDATTYAHNVKIYNLGLTAEQEDKLYELINTEEFYYDINILLEEFAQKYKYCWQVAFNGRSDGYLVLYKGARKALEYKSICTKCGQKNFQTVEASGNCRCGRCGADARVNLSHAIMEPFVYSGQGVDMNEDFGGWTINELRERVKLVRDFDKLCDGILAQVVYMCNNATIEEEVEYIPQKRKILVY